MSARIVLATFGTFGDLHPLLAIALELQRRGHHPVIATSELYRNKIEAEGLGFRAARPDMPPPDEAGELARRMMDPRLGVEYLFRRLLIPALRESYHDLLEASQEADLLVSYPLTLAMPLVAETLAKKWVSVHPWPMSIWSAHDFSYFSLTPLLPSLHRMPAAMNAMMGRSLRPMFNYWMKDVRTLRCELGLPPAENPMFKGQYSPYAALALFSPHFVAPQPDWPAHSIACGYCFHDRRGVMPGDDARKFDTEQNSQLHQFLNSGEPPVVFTLGSAAVYAAQNFYEQSLLAAQELGQRALLLIGDERNRPPSLLQNNEQNTALCYAPYSEVFGAARAIVHHGGGGTIGQVLRAGKPSLAVPFGLDQPDHAMRLHRSGAGRFLARKSYTAKRATREIATLLNTPSYAQRASEIGALVQAENGAATAADTIEGVLCSQ
jgi:UDP:flavonoid glycosyltransferase YjiC (YdhE family)